MARVAAISAGPRSASPRGKRAFSFWGFLDFSAMSSDVSHCRAEFDTRHTGGYQRLPMAASAAGSCMTLEFVMAGPVPAIHVFLLFVAANDVDARDKPGHDEKLRSAMQQIYAAAALPFGCTSAV